jgi:hypothetical protein
LYQHGFDGSVTPGRQFGAKGSWYSLCTIAWTVAPSSL